MAHPHVASDWFPLPETRGKLIALEGIDGAGTTTQKLALTERFAAGKIPLLATAEPSTGPVGRMIREQLRATSQAPSAAITLAQLFAADRIDHLEKEICPALRSGTHVLSDRYLMSSLVYQSLSLPRETVAALNFAALAPDITVYFSIEPKIAEQRRKNRGSPKELFDDLPVQIELAKRYGQEVAELRRLGSSVIEVDASAPSAQVTEAIFTALKNCLSV